MNPEGVPEKLEKILSSYAKLGIAFSGGVDSSYLLYAAVQSGIPFAVYSVETAFRSPVERVNAVFIAGRLEVEPVVIDADILSVPGVAANGPDRCYLCKKALFTMMKERASLDGCDVLCDASNASDDPAERPGMRALEELGIASPLREAGITKEDVRRLSRMAGLPCWNSPSDSCLATRTATGVGITGPGLRKTAEAEAAVRALGFSGFRVRTLPDGTASLEIQESQMGLFKSKEDAVDDILKPGYGGYAVSFRE